MNQKSRRAKSWDEIVSFIQELVYQKQYRLTFHAEEERDADQITKNEIEESILSTECEVLEHYSNDPRGESCLILGFTQKGEPIHIICGISIEQYLIIITVYRPDEKQWINLRKRKE